MTVTLTLPANIEADLIEQAAARGVGIDRYVTMIVEENLAEHADGAMTQTMVGDIPVFSVGRPMPAELVDEMVDALRAERSGGRPGAVESLPRHLSAGSGIPCRTPESRA